MSRLVSDDTWGILTVWQEARGESFEGKLAVAEVILNRMKRLYASDGTVAGTVLRPMQFSAWNASDVNRIQSAKIDTDHPTVQECIKAWHDAKQGSDTVHGAVLYLNPSIVKPLPKWATPEYAVEVARVGAHVFYVPKESA